jgi:uncharacterized protein YigA (DUF484 family)
MNNHTSAADEIRALLDKRMQEEHSHMAVLRERIQSLEEELQTAQERLDENENMRNALLQVQRPKRPNVNRHVSVTSLH